MLAPSEQKCPPLPAAAHPHTLQAIAAMFTKAKKKGGKKKVAASTEDSAATTTAPEAAAVGREDSTLSTSAADAGVGGAATSAAPAAALPAADGFEYDTMLAAVFKILHERNPELGDRRKKILAPPQVSRVGSTRSAWINFQANCTQIKRSMEHVQSFILAETGTTGAIDGMSRLVVRGRYTPKMIEAMLKRYIQVRALDTTTTARSCDRGLTPSIPTCASPPAGVRRLSDVSVHGHGDDARSHHAPLLCRVQGLRLAALGSHHQGGLPRDGSRRAQEGARGHRVVVWLGCVRVSVRLGAECNSARAWPSRCAPRA